MRVFLRRWKAACAALAAVAAACGGVTTSALDQACDAAARDGGPTPGQDASPKGDAATTKDAPTAKDAPTGVDTGTPVDASPIPDASPPPDAPVTCPAAQPAGASACPRIGEVCMYGADECNCSAAKKWACHVCPATQPTVGATCTSTAGAGAAGLCAYGATDCSCTQGAWACDTCPSAEPTNGDSCPIAGEACPYGGDGCLCIAGTGAHGTGTPSWRCEAPCPTTQPAAGSPCNTAAAEQCTYGSTTCTCNGGVYSCT